ncbi:hypothetical protein D3C87_1774410 [compost metagenome]
MQAQYIAESGINSLLYYWNTRLQTPPNQPASYPTFSSIATTYAVTGAPPFTVTTTGTFSITAVASGADFVVTANATASNSAQSGAWQNISRRVTATISSGSLYTVKGYSR